MKLKRCVIVTGTVMGILGACVGMMPKQQTANAAVLVYDAKNVEEAIRTAISTANILTTEEKQLAMQILDMRSMNSDQIKAYLRAQAEQESIAWLQQQAQGGILDPNTSTGTILTDCFPDIGDILNGKIGVDSPNLASQKALGILQKTNEDALSNAKMMQTLAPYLTKSLDMALQNSHNAKGTKEAAQANTQVQAIQASAQIYGNNLLANMAATQALKYQKEVQDEAIAKEINNTTYDNLHSATQNWQAQGMSFEERMHKMGED